jgi:arylsulfatase A-like enzyme
MRWATMLLFGFLFGALLALAEGFAILRTSALGFVSPTTELFVMELRYGLFLGAVALVVTSLLRRRSQATVAAVTFAFGFATLLGWWINKEVLTDSKIWEPISLLASAGVLVLSAALAFLTAWLARRFSRGAALLLVTIVVAAPCFARSGAGALESAEPRAPADRSKPDVTLIVIDTLRADRLSCYGNPRRTSPVLDELAARGVRFDRCISQAPWTRPSMASLHTGLYPSSHGCNDLRDALPRDAMTLAEAMKGAGYVTAGFSANENVSATFGFDQGFDTFWSTNLPTLARFTMYGRLRHFFLKRLLHVPAESVKDDADLLTDQVIRWLGSGHDAPVFTYVHYLDPHWPYEPPEYLLDGAPPPASRYEIAVQAQARFPFAALPEVAPEALDGALRCYDAEIRFCDRAIGRLLARLKSVGQLDPGDLVIVTADHGEQFYEHDSWGHGTSMFQEELRVPLIVAGGGAAGGRVVGDTVRLFDVYPTILDLVGAAIPAGIPAVSMKPLLNGEEDASPRPAFSERISSSWEGRLTSNQEGAFTWETMSSLQIGHRKLIEMRDAERAGEPFYMAFDLEENPQEKLRVRPPREGGKLDRSDPTFTPDAAMVRLLKAVQEGARAHTLSRATTVVPEDQAEILKALGYGK